MILIVIVRRCLCEVCNGMFDLDFDEEPPVQCKICGSKDWELGPDDRISRMIRQGLMKSNKRLNPGVKSKKRQDRAKGQWRQFKKRPEESKQ